VWYEGITGNDSFPGIKEVEEMLLPFCYYEKKERQQNQRCYIPKRYEERLKNRQTACFQTVDKAQSIF
jgi:hypothetical protein